MAGTQTQRALSGLLGERDDLGAGDELFGWAPGPVLPPSESWGVWPPLPGLDAVVDWAPQTPGMRLEPNEADALGVDDDLEHGVGGAAGDREHDDPSNTDAPGQPAMDEVERDAR
jgi:hypothetical protein